MLAYYDRQKKKTPLKTAEFVCEAKDQTFHFSNKAAGRMLSYGSKGW